MSKQFEINPYREVIIASIIFWSTGVFVKYLDMSAASTAFFRLVVPTVVIGARMLYTQKTFWKKGDAKILVSISVLNALRMYLYFVWFTMTSVGNAVVSLYAGPIFAMLFAVGLLREKMNKIKYVSIVLAVCGIGVIAYGKWLSLMSSDLIGIGAILLSAVVWWYLKILLKTGLHTYDKLSMVFHQCRLWTILFFPFVLFARPLPNSFQIELGAVYSFLIGIVWFWFYFSALKKIDVTVFSILQYFEMVAAILLARIILWEPLTWPLLLGAILIVSSGLVLRFETKEL